VTVGSPVVIRTTTPRRRTPLNTFWNEFVYYESIKWELKIKPFYECRCDERLKTKNEESTRLRYTGLLRALEHLTWNKDEVNRREVCECDGWVCVLEVIGTPSMLRLTRKASVLVRVLPTFPFNYSEKRSSDGSGKVHSCIAQAELLNLQKKRSLFL
jgi:hypothetical protein